MNDQERESARLEAQHKEYERKKIAEIHGRGDLLDCKNLQFDGSSIAFESLMPEGGTPAIEIVRGSLKVSGDNPPDGSKGDTEYVDGEGITIIPVGYAGPPMTLDEFEQWKKENPNYPSYKPIDSDEATAKPPKTPEQIAKIEAAAQRMIDDQAGQAAFRKAHPELFPWVHEHPSGQPELLFDDPSPKDEEA